MSEQHTMRFPIVNKQYIDSLTNVATDQINNMLATMETYGQNNWWCSKDKRELGYMQLHERRLLISFSDFHEGVEKLLQRPVWTHEFGVNTKQLKKEAKIAWESGKYYSPSKEELKQNIRQGIKSIASQ